MIPGNRTTRLTCLAVAMMIASAVHADALRVCVTTPDLGSLTRILGEDLVGITELVKGPQDPHFLDPKPSFIKALSQADMFIQAGAGLEIGWAPVLLASARNSTVRPGSKGFFDASTTKIRRIYRPGVDRSSGDVHPDGNPHFLLDPLNGLIVAEQIAERLRTLAPGAKGEPFRRRFAELRSRVATQLFGERLLQNYKEADHAKLLALLDRGGLERFLTYLDGQKQRELLGGWIGALAPYRGAKVVADHDIWPYFARRFGIEVVGFLEPKPGISPTTRHLAELIRSMRTQKVRVILSAPYFDRRHAEFVASKTGAVVVEMAHQTGARKGADGYLDMIDYNVKRLAAALAKTRSTGKPE